MYGFYIYILITFFQHENMNYSKRNSETFEGKYIKLLILVLDIYFRCVFINIVHIISIWFIAQLVTHSTVDLSVTYLITTIIHGHMADPFYFYFLR